MLGDPFLDLDLALVGAMERQLERGALVGHDLDLDVPAGDRRGDEADSQNDGF
jgi:hypothetical protein